MDNVTHALAGCLLAAATVTVVERRGVTLPQNFRTVATVVGIVTAELPDADLVYAGQRLGMGSLGYLLHHRGHTHTVVFGVLGAVLVWLAALAFSKPSRGSAARNALLVLAFAGTASHLALDFTNNYGIHPFWPIVKNWYYGDAVFIIEPWLWVASIPALYLFYRGRAARAILGVLLAIILVASWGVGLVGRDVAVSLTVATLFWFVLTQAATPFHRISYAMGAWLLIEVVFLSASSRARGTVQQTVGATFRDVSLTPLIGNPLCYSALVVEADNGTYRVTDATVAPFQRVRSANQCAAQQRSNVPGTTLSSRPSTQEIRWGAEWHRPLADLTRLASTSCEVAAALEFIRVPVWEETSGDSVQFGDARFGSANGGFATVHAALHPAQCPRFVPGWNPPRADLLR